MAEIRSSSRPSARPSRARTLFRGYSRPRASCRRVLRLASGPSGPICQLKLSPTERSLWTVSKFARLLRVFLSLTLLVNGIGAPIAAHAHGATPATASADSGQTCHHGGPAPVSDATQHAHADHAAHRGHAAPTAAHAVAPSSDEVTAAPAKSNPMRCCANGHCRCGCAMHVALKPTVTTVLARLAPALIAALDSVPQSSAHLHPLLRPPAV